jgi:hypothetical protein
MEPDTDTWPQFAWSPDGARYAVVLERIHSKPPFHSSEIDPAAIHDFIIIVPEEIQPYSPREEDIRNPLYISADPIKGICWSSNGSSICFYIPFEGGSKIYRLPVGN